MIIAFYILFAAYVIQTIAMINKIHKANHEKKNVETELQSVILAKELELLHCERELTATRERLEELENAGVGRPIRAEVSS